MTEQVATTSPNNAAGGESRAQLPSSDHQNNYSQYGVNQSHLRGSSHSPIRGTSAGRQEAASTAHL